MKAETFHVCEMCGTEFMGKPMQIYCSNECYIASRSKHYESYTTLRRKRYKQLLDYADRNNIRELAAKYRPAEYESTIKHKGKVA